MPNNRVELESRVTARSDLLASNLNDNETVMMDMEKGFYYGLDNVGKTIWGYLEKPRRVNDVCDLVEKQFDADRNTIQSDTLEFLNHLLEEGLVCIVEDSQTD